VIGDMVFVSNLRKRTVAYGARTGQKLWSTNKGAFNPAIADTERIYLVGYSSLFAMKPKEAGRKARRQRVQRRQRDRARAQRERVRQRREGLHGHRHGGRGAPPRCHRHRHVEEVDGKRFVVTHSHCHRHVPR
jgi:hypothetical protein